MYLLPTADALNSDTHLSVKNCLSIAYNCTKCIQFSNFMTMLRHMARFELTVNTNFSCDVSNIYVNSIKMDLDYTL
jgi:hypothetical protein